MKLFIFSLLMLCTLLTVVFMPELLAAQTPPMFPDNPDQVPVDGGLGLLAAAGGAYALRRLQQNKKAK